MKIALLLASLAFILLCGVMANIVDDFRKQRRQVCKCAKCQEKEW